MKNNLKEKWTVFFYPRLLSWISLADWSDTDESVRAGVSMGAWQQHSQEQARQGRVRSKFAPFGSSKLLYRLICTAKPYVSILKSGLCCCLANFTFTGRSQTTLMFQFGYLWNKVKMVLLCSFESTLTFRMCLENCKMDFVLTVSVASAFEQSK